MDFARRAISSARHAEMMCREKVAEIFGGLVPDKLERLDASKFPADVRDVLARALAVDHGDDAGEIAFHFTDWNADAAFVVAALLFPERFTADELREGVESFLVHAPAHVLAAARVGGYSTEDVFVD